MTVGILRFLNRPDPGKQIKWLEKSYNRTRGIDNEYIGNLPTRLFRAAEAMKDYLRLTKAYKRSRKDIKRQEKRLRLAEKKQKHLQSKVRGLAYSFTQRTKRDREVMFDSLRKDKQDINEDAELAKQELQDMKSDMSSMESEIRYAKKHLKKQYRLLKGEARFVKNRILRASRRKARDNLTMTIAEQYNMSQYNTGPQAAKYREKLNDMIAKFKKAKTVRDYAKFFDEKSANEFEALEKKFRRVEDRIDIAQSYM